MTFLFYRDFGEKTSLGLKSNSEEDTPGNRMRQSNFRILLFIHKKQTVAAKGHQTRFTGKIVKITVEVK